MPRPVHIVGGGLAGSEAAWQAAARGVPVVLHEMRPLRPTLVHRTDGLAELVCSNSFRGDKLDNAVGLLKEEMRRLGSMIMRAADAARVPAGAALAVDRERFSRIVTATVASHPLITIVREEVTRVPEPDGSPWIIATGPLTSDALSADIVRFVGAEHLSFYDAISPIVLADSIDRSKVFRQSRWDRDVRRAGLQSGHADAELPPSEKASFDDRSPGGRQFSQPACGVDDGQGDYLNCPMTKEEYDRFYDAVVAAESATVHDFDRATFFEGCLPIEVMASRGRDTLRFGPMKPVGLTDPRTGRRPYAVVQLRQDTLAGDHWSLVGFQTQLKWGDQARVLRLIPGLEGAEFVRLGMVHRNTYINGPTVLRDTWQARTRSDSVLRRAGERGGRLRRVGGLGPDRRSERLGARRWRRGPSGPAHHCDWSARALRVACGGEALPAVEHHVRDHGAPRRAAGRAATEGCRAEGRPRRPGTGGPRRVDRGARDGSRAWGAVAGDRGGRLR